MQAAVLRPTFYAFLYALSQMAVRVLNSDSGHLMSGAEKEKSDGRHIEMTFNAWSILRSSFFRRYAATSMAPSMTFLLWTAESSHMF